MTSMQSLYKSCTLCPRQCRARRLDSETGFCRMSSEPLLGRASLHMWEEPCISGTCGSGTVFFAGCSLGCVYCQNRSMIPDSLIPGGGTDLPHCIPASSEELSSLYLRLRDAGAHNINLVTAAHFLPHVIESLQLARQSGLSIPVVYNTSGYERAESLALLEGLTDIYLTDFRYMHPDTASLYSHAPDYPAFAKQAIKEMLRQCPQPIWKENLLQKGVLVRILLLPGHVREAEETISYLYAAYGDALIFSILSQYTPLPLPAEDPLLGRKVTRREYEKLVNHALSLGIKNAYIQEGSAAAESFIPSFDGGIHC